MFASTVRSTETCMHRLPDTAHRRQLPSLVEALAPATTLVLQNALSKRHSGLMRLHAPLRCRYTEQLYPTDLALASTVPRLCRSCAP